MFVWTTFIHIQLILFKNANTNTNIHEPILDNTVDTSMILMKENINDKTLYVVSN